MNTQNHQPIFQKINYYLMLLGGLFFVLGIVLMLGGKSENPNVFDSSEIYSFRRITLAPILILLGFITEVIAILYRQKKNISTP